MQTSLNRLPDGTIELTLTVPWDTVSAEFQKTLKRLADSVTLDGFRKGKAPIKTVEEKLGHSAIYEEMLKTLLPSLYNTAVTEYKLRPIINPKLELKEAKENTDWVLRVLTCERPTVTLGDYKKTLSDLNASKKKENIWVPGKNEKKPEEKPTKPTLDEVLMALYTAVKVEIPNLLLEQEVNRLLSDLIDQTKKLGLTVEQYLASTGRTSETVHKEYEEQAKRTITLEFSLEEIADKEGVLVSDDDIDTVIKTAKTDEERASLEKQRYYLASVLRRQKTLDFLSAL